MIEERSPGGPAGAAAMTEYLLLPAPSANRVYAHDAPRLLAAELEALTGVPGIRPVEVAGVTYLGLTAADLDLAAVGRASAVLACYAADELDRGLAHGASEEKGVEGRQPEHAADEQGRGLPADSFPLLRPIALPRPYAAAEDLLTIPKYQGKTNEQFTRLLLNVTLAARARWGGPRPAATLLDPLCGRGTTLWAAWLLGLDAYGVDADERAVEAMAAFITTYLRRARVKHRVDVHPVRREGRTLGHQLEVEAALDGDRAAPRLLGVYTGDTRDSRALWGKKRFDLIVTDAPYGVVHGSRTDGTAGRTDVRGSGRRERSAAGLLREAIPVWASQLAAGGALGLAWNTLSADRASVTDWLMAAGLHVPDEAPWTSFRHRVDSSIDRDVIVGVAPPPAPRS